MRDVKMRRTAWWVVAGAAVALCGAAGGGRAQDAPGGRGTGRMMGPGDQASGRPTQMARRRPVNLSPAALLLDHQTELKLTPEQVTKLIALYRADREQARAMLDRAKSLLPAPPAAPNGERGQAPEQPRGHEGMGARGLPRLSPAIRDSLMALRETWRETRWRETSAADAVLTDKQRDAAAKIVRRERRMHRRGKGQHGGHSHWQRRDRNDRDGFRDGDRQRRDGSRERMNDGQDSPRD